MAPSKRGLCWPTSNVDPPFIFTKPGSKVSWLYNWSPHPTPRCSLQFIPMQWNHVNIDTLPGLCAQAGAPAVLGFNEPELAEQSNMSVELAAGEWMRCIEPLRKGQGGRAAVRCGSPGISSAPHGVSWLKAFLAAIRAQGGGVDFYALHWYGETLGQFYDYIWSTHHQLGADKPVWITEYAPTNWSVEHPLDKGHVENFVRESCKYLETLDWVERYAFFGAMRDTGTVGRWAAMLDNNGKITEVGKIYRDE
ncbi:glycoside hydrolase family 128 protein [Diplogelasinospora grovesii]|uniref:Glycoside hydrolase family 128 protein n=1 Tax=Diplogelasinospora grovesii TaxID=303347 RepID=A0AAN6MZE3_9PEZI|nr:glycoside hydrolase family 128 protein [Diplogelasinospora grovesii]